MIVERIDLLLDDLERPRMNPFAAELRQRDKLRVNLEKRFVSS